MQFDGAKSRPSDAKLELNCRNRTDRRQGFTQTPGAERPMGGLIIISGEDPGRGSPGDPHRGATWTGPQVFFWNHCCMDRLCFVKCPHRLMSAKRDDALEVAGCKSYHHLGRERPGRRSRAKVMTCALGLAAHMSSHNTIHLNGLCSWRTEFLVVIQLPRTVVKRWDKTFKKRRTG